MPSKRPIPRIASLVGCLLLSSTTSTGGEPLPGDAIWSDAVAVDTDLVVPSGVTLRIEPGTRVALGDSVSIRVEGRLLAQGTESEPIRFTRRADGDRWARLFFIGAADSRLEHCVVEFSDCEGDHKDYYDDRDSNCEPTSNRPPRSYNEAVVVVASHVDIDQCTFQNLPDEGDGGEGDAIAVISDDPEFPGAATASIRGCRFVGIGQGVHTRYSYVLVEDCYFTGHNGDNDDVDLYGESNPPPLIRNNVFLDPHHDDMINPTKCSAVITGNVIAGSDDHGVVLRDRCDPVVVNNVISDCRSGGVAVQNTCDAMLINNTIVDCGRGVRLFDHTGRWGRPYCLEPGSGRATLVNCVIWDCPTTLSLSESPAEDPGSHVTLIHCDLQGGEGRLSVSDSSTVNWGEGNIDADPLFVDASSGDFRLEEGSPLVDAGTGDGAPDIDVDGAPRPCAGGVDIGATELQNCDSSPAPFRRGDANADGFEDVGDVVTMLLHLFAGRELACEKSADADDNGLLELADVFYSLASIFTGGETPPAPWESCGEDPTDDDLTCASYGTCRTAGEG